MFCRKMWTIPRFATRLCAMKCFTIFAASVYRHERDTWKVG